MKKLTAMLLALLLLAALAVPALAAGETGTITVTGAEDGELYSLYRILRIASYSEDRTAILYVVEDGWGDFVNTVEIDGQKVFSQLEGEERDIVDGDLVRFNQASLGVTEADPAGDADKVQRFADKAFDAFVAPVANGTASNGTVVFSNLALGYYLVGTTSGTLCSLDNAMPSVSIADKNVEPWIEKAVWSLDETPAKEAHYAEEAHYNIGDTVTFRVVIHLPPNPTGGAQREGAYLYALEDVLGRGFTFVPNSLSVAEMAANQYNYHLDGQTIEFSPRQACLDTLPADMESTITVTYDALLNENAVVGADGNVNTASLHYGIESTTEAATATVYTDSVEILKYDGSRYQATDDGKQPLAGAEFEFYKGEGTAKELVKLIPVDDSGTVYRMPAAGETTGEESFTTVEGSKITIQGVSLNGKYSLVEKKAPRGYNALTEDTVVNAVPVEVEGDQTTTTLMFKTVEIANFTGTVLPSTGGIGTTIFYVVGGVLIVGAAVVLVTRSRVRKQEGEDEIDEPEDEED